MRARPGDPFKGLLSVDGRVYPCALGRSGVVTIKREGDGGTPRGSFRLLWGYVRKDRVSRPVSGLSLYGTSPYDGWCDAVGDRNYNRPVKVPYRASHETLMRDDGLYDVVIVMDHNVSRRLKRGGSAIFFHIARPDFEPTEGCVAVAPHVMRLLLPKLSRNTRLTVL
ncbi:MAG: L,D-transpeptidase family protein [Pseudomonadota bacterium]